MFGFAQGGREETRPWRADRQSAAAALGATLVWHGRCDQHIIGSGPAIHEIQVTRFPDGATASTAAAAADSTPPEGVRTWWTYQARESDMLPGLRG